MVDPKTRTVLVVDDEIELRDAIAFDFRRKGYQVLVASNGTEAFEILKKEKVDVILSDMRMPGGDGMELLKKIKSLNPYQPVVMFITGFSDVTLEDAYHEGADAVFSKPFDRKVLQTAVIQALIAKEELWKSQVVLENAINVDMKLPNFETAVKAKLISLGRGGMFISFTTSESNLPKTSTQVDFKLSFEQTEMPLLSGVGLVRWVRAKGVDGLPAGLGIEFIYLTEECRSQVIRMIEALSTKSFIPKT